MEIIYSKAFRKALGKLQAREFISVEQAVLAFQSDRQNLVLRDHALKGKMKGLRSFSAGYDLRVIYREKGGFITINLLDVGSHNKVY